MSNKIK